MEKRALTTRDLCFVGIFTAMISVLSQISIPMPSGVPMTLQTFAVALAGIVLGPKKGTLSALIYVLLGAVGVPVFSGFSGGLGIVFGIRGGFILSFPLIALTAGIGADKSNRVWLGFWLVAGSAINYLCGMLLFSLVAPSSLSAAFAACVLPFIPTAILKVVVAGMFGPKLKDLIRKVGVAV